MIRRSGGRQSVRERTIVLVTGASRGIGLEAARMLARKGASVVVTARDPDTAAAAAAASALDLRALDVPLDVAAPASIDRARAAFAREYDRLDVLVNNAAAFVRWDERASDPDFEQAADVFATSLFGTWRMCVAFLPLLLQSRHPRIVNVSSGAGSHGDPRFGLATSGSAPAYGISKAAVNALTAKLAADLADTPVLVNAVCPGLTATWPGAESAGARPVHEGAAGVVWAASLPDDGPRGGLFRDGDVLAW
jgi:NAD(P)-dependent dehydrogenase (short-subunit alcohol dehydrogenase family)